MTEYIKREAVKEAIGFVHLHCVAYGENKSLLDVINEVPAADVVPVIHAHWAQTSKGVIYCSNCGAVCGIGAHIEEVTEDHYFCYYCGAKMDEEDIHE